MMSKLTDILIAKPEILIKEKKVPKGLFFDTIISPNYTFESIAWLCFAIITNGYISWLFWILGTITMTNWAK